jgi:diguanylate cyclase (GGDEF)-like protein
VCDACAGIVRRSSLFARIGGEEFAILLSGVDSAGALVFAERLRAVVAAATLRIGDEDVAATISVGVAMRRPGDATPEDCLRRADEAMYLAKRGGRNRVELKV